MSNWKTIKIKKFADVKGGKRLPAGKEFSSSPTPYPYLRVTDMVNASIDFSNLRYVDADIERAIRNYTISSKDIYVTIAGTIGLFGFVPDQLDNALLTENAAKLTHIDEIIIDRVYLKYYLNSNEVQSQITKEIGIGGGVPKLALHRIANFEIKYPSLPQQRKIAQIFTTIDEVIEHTEAAIAKYQTLKDGLIQDLFSRGIDTNTGKLRPAREEAPELYKETSLGWVPKEWKVQQIAGTTYLKGRIGWQGLKASEFIETGPYLVTGTDFTNGRVNWSTCYHISEQRFSEAPSIHLKNEDILITKDGTIGKVAFVSECPEKAVLNSGIFLMRCKNESYHHKYLFYLLKSYLFLTFLNNSLGGSTIKHLYQRDLERYTFPVPSFEEQQMIIDKLDKVNNISKVEEQNLQKYKTLKQGLMQDLLTGKVSVEAAESIIEKTI